MYCKKCKRETNFVADKCQRCILRKKLEEFNIHKKFKPILVHNRKQRTFKDEFALPEWLLSNLK